MTIDRKKPHAGGEVDAYCTKCRLDLNHRVVAMVGEDVKRVKCLTCDGEHNFRKPAAQREREKEKKAHRAAIHAGTATGPRESKLAPKTEKSNRLLWERSTVGQPPSAFSAYSIRTGFAAGELIKHSKFGDGLIVRVIDPFKVEVLFEDGPKTMAQNTN